MHILILNTLQKIDLDSRSLKEVTAMRAIIRGVCFLWKYIYKYAPFANFKA